MQMAVVVCKADDIHADLIGVAALGQQPALGQQLTDAGPHIRMSGGQTGLFELPHIPQIVSVLRRVTAVDRNKNIGAVTGPVKKAKFLVLIQRKAYIGSVAAGIRQIVPAPPHTDQRLVVIE